MTMTFATSYAAPWLELEFWDSLAEAFMRYFGQAITLQVDTAGLMRAQKAIVRANAAAQSLEDSLTDSKTGTTEAATPNGDIGNLLNNITGDASVPTASVREESNRSSGGGNGDTQEGGARLQAIEEGGRQGGNGSGGVDGQELEEGEERGEASNASEKRLEMLPMGAVGHLGRADRLGIIRKTVPRERRMAVLQRLFHLAQAPAEEVERLVTHVKGLKSNSSPAEIRDVNLLKTWQGVREERATAWEEATEQVRLAAAATAAIGAQESVPAAKDGDDVAATGNDEHVTDAEKKQMDSKPGVREGSVDERCSTIG
ncbi:unnamed protein product [Ectocarpus sp. CCAP 1310/34]|nr:unnamed protein product [Ectocarpus sp. CCAP 1310/34]